MKTNPVQRIKLMMSYDMSKTLNENLDGLPIINENENEIDEQNTAKLLKDLKVAKTVEEKIPALARFFQMTDDAAKLAFAKDFTTLSKDIDNAIKKDIKNGFKGNGSSLGPLTKEVSKQQAMKEILSSNKALSEAEIVKIIEKYKALNKQKAAQMEVKAALKDTKKVGQGTKNVGTDVKAVETEIKTTVTDATKAEAEAALNAGGAVKENSKIKQILDTNKSRIRQMSETAFKKFKAVRKLMGIKWLIGMGLVAAGGAYLWSRVFGGTTTPDSTNTIHPKCITDLLDDDGSSVITTSTGDPVVKVTKTGNPEYDNSGGLLFYTNGRVLTGNKQKRGSWSCKGSSLEVKEEMDMNEQGGGITQAQMIDFVDTAVDDLDGFVAVYNLKSLKDIITKLKGKSYKGKNALTAFMDLYKQDEGGDDFTSDINSVGVRTLGVEGIELKQEILDMLGSSSGGDNNKNTGVGNINIVWDSEKKSDDGDKPKVDDGGKPKVDDGSKPKMTFHKCDNFPFEFKCKSPLIGEIQKCIGVTPSYGNFGPKTLKALQDLKHDVSNGITKEIYDKILEKCGDEETLQSLERTKLEPIVTPQRTLSLSGLADKIKTPELKVPVIKSEPDSFYRALVKAGFIDNVPDDGDGKRRIKYKGPDLDDEQLSNLDTAMNGMGYDRIKQLEKDYGSKYVYLKRD